MKIAGGLQPISEYNRMVAEKSGSNTRSGSGARLDVAQRTVTEHGSFQSKHEAEWHAEFVRWQMQGRICNLQKQVFYDLIVNDVLITRYKADAVFVALEDFDISTLDGPRRIFAGEKVVCDPKGHKTEMYKIKKKLMLALHGVEIIEL